MSDIVKSGYAKRYSKSFLNGGWNKSFLELHRDSYLNVYKKQGDGKCQGSIFMKDVCKYFAYGQYTQGMPDRPGLPSGASYDCIMGIPQKASSKAKIHWFLFSSTDEMHAWMTAICSTLPPPPQKDTQQQSQPAHAGPPPNYGPPSNYGPPPPNAGPGPSLGFENLTAGGAPPPYQGANQYRPPSPYPQGPHYAPQHQAYGPPPPAQYGPPPTAYPQQAYYPAAPAQGYPRQQYSQQPTGYPRQPYYMQPAGAYQAYPQQGYIQQQPVVYRQKQKKGILGSNTGKMVAGLAGGALLGYGASRMLGGGWGLGRWGSWSSLSSCGSFGSVGSFGSFGSFD